MKQITFFENALSFNHNFDIDLSRHPYLRPNCWKYEETFVTFKFYKICFQCLSFYSFIWYCSFISENMLPLTQIFCCPLRPLW